MSVGEPVSLPLYFCNVCGEDCGAMELIVEPTETLEVPRKVASVFWTSDWYVTFLARKSPYVTLYDHEEKEKHLGNVCQSCAKKLDFRMSFECHGCSSERPFADMGIGRTMFDDGDMEDYLHPEVEKMVLQLFPDKRETKVTTSRAWHNMQKHVMEDTVLYDAEYAHCVGCVQAGLRASAATDAATVPRDVDPPVADDDGDVTDDPPVIDVDDNDDATTAVPDARDVDPPVADDDGDETEVEVPAGTSVVVNNKDLHAIDDGGSTQPDDDTDDDGDDIDSDETINPFRSYGIITGSKRDMAMALEASRLALKDAEAQYRDLLYHAKVLDRRVQKLQAYKAKVEGEKKRLAQAAAAPTAGPTKRLRTSASI